MKPASTSWRAFRRNGSCAWAIAWSTILPARSAWADCLFVMQGIHADHFPEDLPPDRLAVRVRELAERYETKPTYAIHRTTW